jgi:8-oxo-dGTP pyrophosphatase MutT (NUDIX family)
MAKSPSKLFRVGVGAIITKDGKLLLGLRGPKARDQHYKWELLGGLVEFGESLEEAIKREVMEETGLEVVPGKIIGNNARQSPDGSEQWVGITFECVWKAGEPRRTEYDRVLEFEWHDLESALNRDDLTPMTRLQLEQYRNWLRS